MACDSVHFVDMNDCVATFDFFVLNSLESVVEGLTTVFSILVAFANPNSEHSIPIDLQVFMDPS